MGFVELPLKLPSGQPISFLKFCQVHDYLSNRSTFWDTLYLYKIVPFIPKIYNIKSSVKIIRDQIVLFPVWIFISASYTHVDFSAAPHHHERSQLPGSWPSVRMPLPCCEINLVLATPFCRKSTDTWDKVDQSGASLHDFPLQYFWFITGM